MERLGKGYVPSCSIMKYNGVGNRRRGLTLIAGISVSPILAGGCSLHGVGDDPVKNKNLTASTLIEAIVASTIFLIVFMLSLETVSRLTAGRGNDEWVLTEADHCADLCFAKYGDGKHPSGIYVEEFGWGKVEIVISRYIDYDDLREVIVRA